MSEYYTRKYKRKGSKKRLWIFLGVLLAILIFIIVFFQTNVNRVLVSVSEATVQAMTTTAVNDAVFQTMETRLLTKTSFPSNATMRAISWRSPPIL